MRTYAGQTKMCGESPEGGENSREESRRIGKVVCAESSENGENARGKGHESGERFCEESCGEGRTVCAAARRGKRLRHRAVLARVLAAVLLLPALLLAACTMEKADDEKVRDLEFTVIGEGDAPQELQEIIAQKKTQPFKMTYSDDQNLYIIVGYGPQSTGGYSIAVEELYLTENSIVINTELQGPAKGETVAPETSYPLVIVKTEYLEDPVVFD